MSISAYPLQWPAGWKRTEPGARKHAKFGKRRAGNGGAWKPLGDLSIAEAVGRLRAELAAMNVRDDDLVISTNLTLRLDGLPTSSQREPGDSGAAVYWRVKGEMRCMAIDQYVRTADNLAAIAATLEAMRAIKRHGGAEILDRAFTGFAALASPAPIRSWREILGFLPADTVTSAEVERRFKFEIKGKHPDQGGDPEAFASLVGARELARKELCYDTDQSDWGKG